MSIYQTLRKILNGKWAQSPAKIIDDIYAKPTTSFFAKAKNIFGTRLIAVTLFPIYALTDVIFGTLRTLGFKTRQVLTTNPELKATYRKKAQKSYENLTKTLLGLLAFPIGMINPKLVTFYFIPKREKYGQVMSGGHLFSVRPEIQYPKSIKELQQLIVQANKNGKKISVIGAGRSQGQQFLPKSDNAVIINMLHFNEVKIDSHKKTVTAGAGAIWGDVQLKANQHALAVKIMQASNVFSIGGSISTNIHGWNKGGTLASTIRQLTIIDANGKLKTLKPNDELFKYVVGGYNQFGVIVSAEIELTNNEILIEKSISVKPENYVEYFKNSVAHNNNNRMHLYRLSLSSNNMLQEGVAVNYIATHKTKVKSTQGFHLEPVAGTRLQRILINLGRRFSWMRNFYWRQQKTSLLTHERKYTTNEIMQPPINAMFNHSISESEWLQEYFIPGENLASFLKELGPLLSKNNVNLLNATVRYVKKDNVSKMGYANEGDRFAVVLCFNQNLNPEAIITAKKWVRKSIDLSLKHGGTYYLPYQPFASKSQFSRAYPTAKAFYQKKLEVDPKETFTSGFAEKYLAPNLDEKNHYKDILSSKANRQKFAGFLDNILDRVDKDKFYKLLDEIIKYSDTNLEIYMELSKRISEIMPTPIMSARRLIRSLNTIKSDLSQQAFTLMGKQAKQKVNGLIEIGYPGRFIKPMKEKLNISGQITVLNDTSQWSDLIQSGFPKPYDRFINLNDFAPLNKGKFKDNSVDMITCFTGLHHIPEIKMDGFLRSLNRVLRKGGSFMLVDHNVTDKTTRDLATMAHSVYNAVMGVSVEDEMNEIRNFKSLEEWKTILARYGFEAQSSGNKKMVRTGDSTQNTMIRFVKKTECRKDLTQQVRESRLQVTEDKAILFSHRSKSKHAQSDHQVKPLPTVQYKMRLRGTRV